MDDDDLYDEFGNYIGPELASSEEDDDFERERDADERSQSAPQDASGGGAWDDDGDDAGGGAAAHDTSGMIPPESINETAIVLHEDKQFYPEASEVYPEAETLVMEEDAQPLEQPIIAPVRSKAFSALEPGGAIPSTTYSTEFMVSLMRTPQLVRNIVVLGQLHHGKTVMMDMLIAQTHDDREHGAWAPFLKSADKDKQRRYTDARHDEQQRELSIKATPVSLVLAASSGKSHLLNVIDCPGHVCFSDECTAGLRVADGALLCVDAVDGLMMSSARLCRQAVRQGTAVVLCITKVDRLILELKLPPADAYQKLLHIVEDTNALLASCCAPGEQPSRISPELGNVVFSAAQHGWSFTLGSFAQLYADRQGHCGESANRQGQDGGSGRGRFKGKARRSFDTERFAKRLWGDFFFDSATRRFVTKAPDPQTPRAFVQFVLDPLYKIYSTVLGARPDVTGTVLRSLGVRLSGEQLRLDVRPLLRAALSSFFGAASGMVDALVQHVPSPIAAARAKVMRTYTGPTEDASAHAPARAMNACDATGPLMLNVVKLIPSSDGSEFAAFGRIMSGSVQAGDKVRVLGERFCLEDDEDSVVCEVARVCVGQARYRTELRGAVPAGNWVMLDGVDATISKSATITHADTGRSDGANALIFSPLQHDTISTVKLAVEPLKPAELPKMLDALRSVNKTYPLATTRVEESGEHVLMGTGELYLDCALHDLRQVFSDVEVKVADPAVAFCETVSETSSLQCHAQTPNGKNTLSMLAEPLESGLGDDIEQGEVSASWDKRELSDFFRSKYDWDLLAARNVWSFGADAQGPNVLLDDTLPMDVDKALLGTCRDHVVQGFQWGCRQGPLCEEPMRNVKFKLVGADIAEEALARGGGQIIPTARRVAYSAFLLGTPRLMEPVYSVEIQAPADVVPALYDVLQRRRGHIMRDAPTPGSPLYTVKAFLPVIDSFGFETDLRSFTQGQAMCQQVFDHWSIVPGDPLDRAIVLHPLEPAPVPHLAREFMVKTRRRKGLSEDVSVNKFFDDSMLAELAAQAEGME